MHTRKERFEALVLRALDNPDVVINTGAFILLTSCFANNAVLEEEIQFLQNSITSRVPAKEEDVHLTPSNVFLLNALMWQYGIGVDANQGYAKTHFMQAASRQHPFAYACLAEIYQITRETELQQACWQRALDLDCMHVHYQQARNLCNSDGGANYQRLIKAGTILDNAVKQNHLPAMLMRAQLYLENCKHKNYRRQPAKAADLLCRAYDIVCSDIWWEHPLATQVHSAIVQLDKREEGRFLKIRFRATILNLELSSIEKFAFYLNYNQTVKTNNDSTEQTHVNIAINAAVNDALLEDAHQLVGFIINSTLLTESEKIIYLSDLDKLIDIYCKSNTQGSFYITPDPVANGAAAVIALTTYLKAINNPAAEALSDTDSIDTLSSPSANTDPQSPPRTPQQPSFWQPSPGTPLHQKKRSVNTAGLLNSPVPSPF